MKDDGDGLDELIRRLSRCDALARRRLDESRELRRQCADTRMRLQRALGDSAAFCASARAFVAEARAAIRRPR